jgi:hypothetical protein
VVRLGECTPKESFSQPTHCSGKDWESRVRWEVLGMPPSKPRDYWQLILWEVLRRVGAEKTRLKIASIAKGKWLTIPLHSQHCILNWSSRFIHQLW